MLEVNIKTSEHPNEPGELALSYTEVTQAYGRVIDGFHERLDGTKNFAAHETLVQNLLEKLSASEFKRLEDADAERYVRVVQNRNPRHTGYLAEMALEIQQLIPGIDYAAHEAARETDQAETADKLYESYRDKFKLSEDESEILKDFMKMSPDELEEVYYQFEGLGHKFDHMNLRIKQTKQELSDEAAQKNVDEVERQHQKKQAKAQIDATHEANNINFVARRTLFELEMGIVGVSRHIAGKLDLDKLPIIDKPYELGDERAKWATDRLTDFMLQHPDRRTREYKNGLIALRQELFFLGLGRAAYEQDGGNNKKTNRQLIKRGIISSKSRLDKKPTPEALTKYGTILFAELQAKRAKRTAKKESLNRSVDSVREIARPVLDLVVDTSYLVSAALSPKTTREEILGKLRRLPKPPESE